MRIAIPSEGPGGLEAAISEHFGHCDAFTIVSVDGGEIGDVTVVQNAGHEQGGCMAPVRFLKEQDVEILVAGGMGMRPLAGFRSVGITVFFKEDAVTVQDAVQRYLDGKCREFGREQTCGGGGTCGDHDHDVEREPIEGKADVQPDRVVSFDYELRDTEGNMLDASSGHGPLRYLHGHGNIVPGLEKALAGLEAGAHVVVDVPASEGYGARDEERVFEVPRDQLPGHAKVGDAVHAQMAGGRVAALTILALDDETVRLDANHPLAGKDLVFDVTIVRVEAATADEIAHGHVH
jgi:FKBP-type peptidyl-prolyl cis-trans isomerase 2/predicted Fe-Mo cluster-binding NifX family protein